MAYEGKIPFDQHGNPVPFAPNADAVVWKDNEPFRATLIFKGFQRGRSAAHAIYAKDDDPTWEVAMFLSDLKTVIELGCKPQRIQGRFAFVKRGQNYGIKLLIGP